MDREQVVEHADVVEHPSDLLPDGTDEPTVLATDPETECVGIGAFEREARRNLVYAVEAYRERPKATTPYMSAGRGSAQPMRWLDESPSLVERVQRLLSF
jgi:hypothetical protein